MPASSWPARSRGARRGRPRRAVRKVAASWWSRKIPARIGRQQDDKACAAFRAVFSASSSPPKSRTMSREMASLRPSPSPAPLVVKKVRRCGRAHRGRPQPVSDTPARCGRPLRARGVDRQHALRGQAHRIRRIADQVDQHLLQAIGVAPGEPLLPPCNGCRRGRRCGAATGRAGTARCRTGCAISTRAAGRRRLAGEGLQRLDDAAHLVGEVADDAVLRRSAGRRAGGIPRLLPASVHGAERAG